MKTKNQSKILKEEPDKNMKEVISQKYKQENKS